MNRFLVATLAASLLCVHARAGNTAEFVEATGALSPTATGTQIVVPGFVNVTLDLNAAGTPGYLVLDITPGTAAPLGFINLVNESGVTLTQFDVRLGSLDGSLFTAGGGPVFTQHPLSNTIFDDIDGVEIEPYHGRISGFNLAPGDGVQLQIGLSLPDTGPGARRDGGTGYELAIELAAVPEPASLHVMAGLACLTLLRRVRKPQRHTV